MPNMSVGGLVSGLDTATIISQLMQLEARPQTMLKGKVSDEQKIVTALQGLNTKLASIATKAADLAKIAAWSTTRSTSSHEGVTVTTTAAASPAVLDLTVGQKATSHTIDFGLHALTDTVASDGSTVVYLDRLDGTAPVGLDTKDGTVQGLVDAVNSQDTGLRATLVQVTGGSYRFTVTATTTGTGSDFELQDGAGLNQSDAGTALSLVGTATSGLVARITVGSDLIESESNTFRDLMPGVDVTLGAVTAGDTATIAVEHDTAKLSESVKALVDSVNAALSEVGTLTAYDAASRKAGLLGGDSTLRSVRTQLLESVSRGLGDESLAAVGIQVDRYGKLTFDEARFKDAYAADPVRTTATFAGTDQTPANDKNPYDPAFGFADRLKVLGEAFSRSSDGTITTAIVSRQSAIRGMEDDIADWGVRLDARRTAMQRQYTALETALGKLQSQGNWLAGQLASLPTMSSGQ